MLKRELGAESNGKIPHLFIPSKTAILVPEIAAEDLPFGRTAGLVSEFAVNDLFLSRTLWWWHIIHIFQGTYFDKILKMYILLFSCKIPKYLTKYRPQNKETINISVHWTTHIILWIVYECLIAVSPKANLGAISIEVVEYSNISIHLLHWNIGTCLDHRVYNQASEDSIKTLVKTLNKRIERLKITLFFPH